MGLWARLMGRERQPLNGGYDDRDPGVPDDERAIERYRYLLRTAPPDQIEQAHAEAFGTLTPEQRQQVLMQLSDEVPPGERAQSDDPRALARMATRAEMRQPGTLERTFGAPGGAGFGGGGLGMGMGMGGMFAGTLLASVAGAFIGTAIAGAMFDAAQADEGSEASASDDTGSEYGDSGSESGDASGGDSGGGDWGGGGGGGDWGGDSGGGDWGGSGDFGGGDFGGGDF